MNPSRGVTGYVAIALWKPAGRRARWLSPHFYRLEGECADDGSVLTLRSFLDGDGHPLPLDDINDQARHLVRLMPVLRLRDARFMRRIRNGTVPDSADVEVTARQLDFLARELATRPQNLTDGQIRRGYRPWCSCWSTIFPSRGWPVPLPSDAPSLQ